LEDKLMLHYDLTFVPDPDAGLAKYLVEAYFEKEEYVKGEANEYEAFTQLPFGVIEAFPPTEKYAYKTLRDSMTGMKNRPALPPILH
jgi:hypothetical protein